MIFLMISVFFYNCRKRIKWKLIEHRRQNTSNKYFCSVETKPQEKWKSMTRVFLGKRFSSAFHFFVLRQIEKKTENIRKRWMPLVFKLRLCDPLQKVTITIKHYHYIQYRSSLVWSPRSDFIHHFLCHSTTGLDSNPGSHNYGSSILPLCYQSTSNPCQAQHVGWWKPILCFYWCNLKIEA